MPSDALPRSRGTQAHSGRLAFACLLAALLWAPLPLGSNRPWATALLAGLVWVGLCLAAIGFTLGFKPARPAPAWPAGLRHSASLLLVALGFCAWVAVQYSLSSVAGLPGFSEDAFASRHFLLRTLAFVGALVLTLWVVNSQRRLVWVLGTVVGSGLAQALATVMLHASGVRYQFLFEEFEQGARATGTFVNPDHLAGYLLVCLAAGLGLMLSLLGGGKKHTHWRARLTAMAEFLVSRKMLLRLALVVMVIALVLTHSRMGNGAFFISIVLIGALVAGVSAHLRRPALWLVGSMLVIDLLIIGQWVGLDKVAARMRGTAEASSVAVASFGLSGFIPPPKEQSLLERLEVPLAALPLVAQRPVAGWGGGSFGLAFAPMKPNTAYTGFWDHAHNDFVQVAVETGLVGFGLWLGMGVLTVRRALPLLKDGQPPLCRGVAVAALMALSCLGLHGLVDFNLYIPATAMTLSVLLALVWVAPGLPKSAASHGYRRAPRPLSLSDDE